MLLILDLHYSHHDQIVKNLLHANNIIGIYIPAGCTNFYQVCDVVVNKPYKNGVTAAFVDYVSNEYIVWNNCIDRTSDDLFILSMKSSVMKPLIPSFVTLGIKCLKTEKMKTCIQNCYNKEGLVGVAKQNETFQRANTKRQCYDESLDEVFGGIAQVLDVEGGDIEPEEDLGPVPEDEDEDNCQLDQRFDIEVKDGESTVYSEDSEDEEDEDSSEDNEISVRTQTI